jgi:hypothetical protein
MAASPSFINISDDSDSDCEKEITNEGISIRRGLFI